MIQSVPTILLIGLIGQIHNTNFLMNLLMSNQAVDSVIFSVMVKLRLKKYFGNI